MVLSLRLSPHISPHIMCHRGAHGYRACNLVFMVLAYGNRNYIYCGAMQLEQCSFDAFGTSWQFVFWGLKGVSR